VLAVAELFVAALARFAVAGMAHGLARVAARTLAMARHQTRVARRLRLLTQPHKAFASSPTQTRNPELHTVQRPRDWSRTYRVTLCFALVPLARQRPAAPAAARERLERRRDVTRQLPSHAVPAHAHLQCERASE
jgi:hypothetical protein